jgi:hypothetical protein
MRITYKYLDRASGREGQLGIPVFRWKDTIKADFIGIFLTASTCFGLYLTIFRRNI